MPYFLYIGDKPKIDNVYGYIFEQGKPTEVTNDLAINKLSNNSHFKKVPKPRKKAKESVDVKNEE